MSSSKKKKPDAVPSVDCSTEASARPTVDELARAERIEVATASSTSDAILVGGVICTPEPRTILVRDIATLGDCYLRAIAESEQITVRIVE